MNPNVLGVVTARGGSKSIPAKNIKPLLGKPLIVYTIESAQKSGVFDRLILSTDDKEIAAMAQQYGCEVPFMRPAELAQDATPHLPVMQHAVKWLKDNENYWPDYVMILQPTSPLRQPFHIREAVELISKTRADSVIAVCPVPDYLDPSRSLVVINKEGFLELFNGKPLRNRATQRQNIRSTYFNTTAIYLFKPEFLFDTREPNFFGDKVAPYIIDAKYSVDINEPDDWMRAEEASKKIENK